MAQGSAQHSANYPSASPGHRLQAQAQAAAAVGAHSGLSQERKELQGRLDRLAVERDRAARERDASELRCAALQQQCRLLEAVAHGQAAIGDGSWGRHAGSKENGGRGITDRARDEFAIKALRKASRAQSSRALSTSSSE
jgi:hypothetical protein